MFYCTCDPDRQGDRVRLYRDMEAAIAADRECRPVYEVALNLDAGDRLVVSSEFDASDFDPYWTMCAQLHGDGSITAKGTIPRALSWARSTRRNASHAFRIFAIASGVDRNHRDLARRSPGSYDPGYVL